MNSDLSTGRGIQGHLRLVCGPDSRGLSSLREQSFRAPIHLSKPHWDQGTLVLNVVNPTAGLMDGDRIEQDVRVQPGGRLLLTSPSASRAHRVREGWAAISQTFHVEAGGFLEVLPEIFIPQSGAHYRQTTTARVDIGGELILSESLAPGRVASGEVFEYKSLDWKTDIFIGEESALRERYAIQPGTPSVESLRSKFPTAYYASITVVSSRFNAESPCWATILGLQESRLLIGLSSLGIKSAWSIKWIAADAPTLRAVGTKIREALYDALGTLPPDLRRISGR